jgi:hypothetical protein
MFRYGGPIKEGVMSGIREPKKTGGAALVGNPLFPKDASGRARHGWWIPLGMAGSAVLRTVAPRVATNKALHEGLKKTLQTGAGKKVTDKGITAATTGWKNLGKNWFSGDPLVKGSKWGWKTLTSPTANTWAQKAVKMAISPSSIIAGTAYYLWPDGKERTTPPPQNTGGAGKKPWESNEGMMGDGSWFAAQAEKEANIAKQKEWNNRIKKYRDIMDIKGMNKEAAYKSLVDASKLIQESQDFKGDIKSGKLINQVIQAASKQFDKPKKTSDAINTLILQNELKKDLESETNKDKKTLLKKQILIADKTLAGDSTAEVIQAIALRTGMPQSDQLNQLVSLNNPELNLKTIPTKDMGQKDPITYIAEIVSSVNNDPKTPNYPAGNYVIKDKIVQITEDGTVTPIPINQLK